MPYNIIPGVLEEAIPYNTTQYHSMREGTMECGLRSRLDGRYGRVGIL